MRLSLVTWLGESDVILTCDEPTGEASECSNVLEGEVYRTHLASKESKTGLPWEAQSSSMEVLMRPRGRVAQAEDAV